MPYSNSSYTRGAVTSLTLLLQHAAMLEVYFRVNMRKIRKCLCLGYL